MDPRNRYRQYEYDSYGDPGFRRPRKRPAANNMPRRRAPAKRSRHPSSKSTVLMVTVTRCSVQVMEDEVEKLFCRYGHLASRPAIVNVAPNGDTEVEVEYYNVEDAAEAFKQTDGQSMYEGTNQIRIQFLLRPKSAQAAAESTPGYYRRQPRENPYNRGRTDYRPRYEGGGHPGYEARPPWGRESDHQASNLLVSEVDMASVTSNTLVQLFGVYGDVMRVTLLRRSDSAFVQMSNKAQTKAVLRFLDNCPLAGRKISIAPAGRPQSANARSYYRSAMHRYRGDEGKRWKRAQCPPSKWLRVSCIPESLEEAKLRALFNIRDADFVISQVEECEKISTHRRGRVWTARLELQSKMQAVHALILRHNFECKGQTLQVQFAPADTEPEPKPNSGDTADDSSKPATTESKPPSENQSKPDSTKSPSENQSKTASTKPPSENQSKPDSAKSPSEKTDSTKPPSENQSKPDSTKPPSENQSKPASPKSKPSSENQSVPSSTKPLSENQSKPQSLKSKPPSENQSKPASKKPSSENQSKAVSTKPSSENQSKPSPLVVTSSDEVDRPITIPTTVPVRDVPTDVEARPLVALQPVTFEDDDLL